MEDQPEVVEDHSKQIESIASQISEIIENKIRGKNPYIDYKEHLQYIQKEVIDSIDDYKSYLKDLSEELQATRSMTEGIVIGLETARRLINDYLPEQ